jgi:hypothetical protein
LVHGIEVLLGFSIILKLVNSFQFIASMAAYTTQVIISLLVGYTNFKFAANFTKRAKQYVKYDKQLKEKLDNGPANQNRRAQNEIR